MWNGNVVCVQSPSACLFLAPKHLRALSGTQQGLAAAGEQCGMLSVQPRSCRRFLSAGCLDGCLQASLSSRGGVLGKSTVIVWDAAKTACMYKTVQASDCVSMDKPKANCRYQQGRSASQASGGSRLTVPWKILRVGWVFACMYCSLLWSYEADCRVHSIVSGSSMFHLALAFSQAAV